MKKKLFLKLFLCIGICQIIFAQNANDLKELINLNPTVFRNYSLDSSKQIPNGISVVTYGGIERYTACLNGSVAVLPLKNDAIIKGKAFLKRYSDLNITYKKTLTGQNQLIVLLYDDTGADLGETIWMNIGGNCKDSTELSNERNGVNIGHCNVNALAKGKIFLVNTIQNGSSQ